MKPFSATKLYALAFGFFLGLCLWKFGNPVILDHKVESPRNLDELWVYAWPPHWANWILLPLAIAGAVVLIKEKGERRKANKSSQAAAPIFHLPSSIFVVLPLVWLGWQFVSAANTVDVHLTTATLWQFSGCVFCYFLGALLFSRKNLMRWLLPGLLAAFAFCLVRGADQKLFEFPQSHQMLAEGERSGWTNYPPETVAEMKRDAIIISTNGVDVANPVIMDKFRKGRVAGTLVYPNALAGAILLLWPMTLALVFGGTRNVRPLIRWAAIGLATSLGGVVFFWTGSKLGWLLGLGVVGIYLLRLKWSKKAKMVTVVTVLLLGLGVFALRFHQYFSSGATSVSARLDYWRAAVQTAASNPLFGTGPGTFQRPYEKLKSPESEMARLTHNDYLEQFSDSGLIGGLAFAAWIILGLVVAGRRIWKTDDGFSFAIYLGVMAWFVQGLGEFSLYIPALAWITFTLLGIEIGSKRIEFDKNNQLG